MASNIWSGLVASFPCMGKWLAWKIGNGNQVKLSEDQYIGGEGFYKLSPSIILYLNNIGFRYLAHVKIPKSKSIVTHYCLHVEELGLEREIDEERKSVINGLNHCGIILTDMEDEIVWSWNVSTR